MDPIAIPMITAAGRGFAFADLYAIGLIFCAVALFAAIGALSHQGDRAFSASIIYLGLGAGAALAIELIGLNWLEPVEDAELIERVSELALIIALFGAGLKLDRAFTRRSWSGVARLLLIAMPLTIAGVALFGHEVMGLSLGAAVILGAILAPTDPVLAGDIGVGPPGDEEEQEPNFSITGEAGMNDGLAFPFIFAGLFILDPGGTDWIADWLLADVVYALGVGLLIGVLVGFGVAALTVHLRNSRLLSPTFDGWLAIPTVLLIYGLTETAGAYGFIAAFAGGVAFRRYERSHEINGRVHDGAETVEKIGELTVILLFGSMLSISGLEAPGWSGWLLVPVLLLVIRPLSVAIATTGSRNVPYRERFFLAWFGVRGIGSIYYAAIAAGAVQLPGPATNVIVWTAFVCVLVSILVHGITATPLSQALLPEPGSDLAKRRLRWTSRGGGGKEPRPEPAES